MAGVGAAVVGAMEQLFRASKPWKVVSMACLVLESTMLSLRTVSLICMVLMAAMVLGAEFMSRGKDAAGT
jgi:hypothetical protein